MNKLLVFRLSVQSSYKDNIENAASEVRFDTVQWWFSANETWRIRTFATDLDIHTHCIADTFEEEVAIENTMKNFGDVVAEAFIVELENPNDEDEVAKVMKVRGGARALEIAVNGGRFAFWNPARLAYASRSAPT
jgi:hypothetical protein